MTDKEVLNYLWPNNICLLKNKLNKHLIPNEIIDYLNNRFSDSDSIAESLYRIKYNIDQKPCCVKCGKPIKFSYTKNSGHFNKFCSRSCQIDNINIHKKIFEKYGTTNVSQLDFVKEKIKKNNLIKYGVTNTFSLKKSINKSKETRKNNKEEWINKIKKTNIKKYGVEIISQADFIQEKIKQTYLNKYGVTSWTKTLQGREKLSKLISSDIVQEKTNKTKTENHSYNRSNTEDESYILLKEKYPDIIRQYRSELYPFDCDFYIPSLDLYIECNYFWTHGFKPYEGTSDDLKLLNKWKKGNTIFYNNAIKNWTISDVKKRNIAKQNNLKWIEFFNINELKLWIQNQE